MVKLALYKGKRPLDLMGALIRWWTDSPYSHCEVVVDGLWYSSSIRDGGVRVTNISEDLEHWDFIELPEYMGKRVLSYFADTVDEPYGWKDLILRQVFNKRGNSVGAFCSEWCAAALGFSNPETYSPGLLEARCRRLENELER